MAPDANTFPDPAIICSTKKEKTGYHELSCNFTEIQLTKIILTVLRAQSDDLGKYVQLCTIDTDIPRHTATSLPALSNHHHYSVL